MKAVSNDELYSIGDIIRPPLRGGGTYYRVKATNVRLCTDHKGRVRMCKDCLTTGRLTFLQRTNGQTDYYCVSWRQGRGSIPWITVEKGASDELWEIEYCKDITRHAK